MKKVSQNVILLVSATLTVILVASSFSKKSILLSLLNCFFSYNFLGALVFKKKAYPFKILLFAPLIIFCLIAEFVNLKTFIVLSPILFLVALFGYCCGYSFLRTDKLFALISILAIINCSIPFLISNKKVYQDVRSSHFTISKYKLRLATGNLLNLSSFGERDIYIFFWFTPCTPCAKMKTWFYKFNNSVSKKNNAIFLSVCSGNLNDFKTFKSLVAKDTLFKTYNFYNVYDEEGKMSLSLPVYSYPSFYKLNESTIIKITP